MGQSLFNRVASITIGKAGEKGLKITGLHMTFKIEKTLGTSSNKAKISIFNLSERSRAILTQENAKIIIEAGTGRSVGIVFSGDVIDAVSKKTGQDIVTQVNAAEGHTAINAVKVDKTYPGGTNFRTIMEDLAQEMISGGDVSIGNITSTLTAKTQNGIVVTGSAGESIEDIARQNGLSASIQNGEIIVVNKDDGYGGVGLVLSSETGLVGTPQKTKDGFNVDSLILGQALNPGRKIKVISNEISGIFAIQKANIDGSVFGGPWMTRMEVK